MEGYKIIITIVFGIVIISIIGISYCYLALKYWGSDENNYIYDSSYIENKYKGYRVLVVIIFIVSMIGLVTVLANIMLVVSKFAIENTGESIYIIKPDYWFWTIPSLFLGNILSAFVITIFMKIILGKNYSEFYEVIASPYGVDARSGQVFSSILVVVLCIGISIHFTLGLNWYVRFTDNSMVVNDYLSFNERSYSYKDINKIIEYNGYVDNKNNIKKKYHIELDFSNGYIWTSLGYGRSDDYQSNDEEIANFISSKTGLKIINEDIDITNN